MVKKWVTWIDYSACGIIALLLLGALWFVFARQTTFSLSDTATKKAVMPKRLFERPLQEYESIGPPALTLTFSPLSVQLPDLRRYLIYYGKNGRPDAQQEQPTLYFAFTGNKTPSPVQPGERLYLLYDKSQTPNQYIFSPNNAPTPLWIEAAQKGNLAVVKAAMLGDSGQIISEPAAYAEFTLPEKEFVRFGGVVWEIGKWRVDGTLLARQKARWYGIDRFLERHGGEEYKEWQGKQRIDFEEGEDTYSAYVGLGDCLVWKDSRWQNIKVGEASLNFPLMCIKKIDERVMNLELWDVGGKGKISLNLVKATEAWLPQNLEQSFKFIGARTRSQFVFEINKERVLLSPHDWLLLTDAGWKKLITPQEIDDYVQRKKTGPLFVFDRIERKDDRQIIIGTLFNASRTEMASIELSLQQPTGASSKAPLGGKTQKTKETKPSSMVKTGNNYRENPSNAKAVKESDRMRVVPEDDGEDDDDE